MPAKRSYLVFALLIASATPINAVEKPDAAARAKVVAPFLDEQTIVVGRLDVTAVKPEALVNQVVEMIPEAEAQSQEAKAGLSHVQSAALKAGIKEIYMVLSMADVPQSPPLLVVPLGPGADEEAIAGLFAQSRQYLAHERSGNVLLLGSKATLARIKTLKPADRPEVAKAIAAAGDAAAQAVFVPAPYVQRVISEMMPELPKEIGDGTSAILIDGVLWAAVGIDPPPKLSLRVVVQSKNASAAAALHQKWLAAYQVIGQEKEVRGHLPNFDKIAKVLTPKVEGDQLVLVLDEKNQGVAAFVGAAKPPLEAARAAAKRAQSINNLKQIALAFHMYHDVNKHFPAAASYDAQKKPLLSWRVHILPYIEQEALYKQFHLDEPWDSEHNRKLIEQMPQIYRSPASKLKEKGHNSYVVPTGKETVFPNGKGMPINEIKDGTSNTIMLLEVDDQHAPVWTKPEDFPVDLSQPAKGLGGVFEGGFLAAFCDGSVHIVSDKIKPNVLRALFTRNGGEAIDPADMP